MPEKGYGEGGVDDESGTSLSSLEKRKEMVEQP